MKTSNLLSVISLAGFLAFPSEVFCMEKNNFLYQDDCITTPQLTSMPGPITDTEKFDLLQNVTSDKSRVLSLWDHHRLSSEALHQYIKMKTEEWRSKTNTQEDLSQDFYQKAVKEMTNLYELKIKTAYILRREGKPYFEGGVLLEPKQIQTIFEKLMINGAVLEKNGVDPNRLADFFSRHIDLPAAKLPENTTSLKDLYSTYIEMIDNIQVHLQHRLKEDVFTVEILCAMMSINDNLNLQKHNLQEEEILTKLKSSQKKGMYNDSLFEEEESYPPSSPRIKPCVVFEGILKIYGYQVKDKKLDKNFMIAAARENSNGFLQRLCGALKAQQLFSWNTDEERLEVKVRDKLRENDKIDVSEEFINIIYRILGRYLNQQALVSVKSNFEIAISDLNEETNVKRLFEDLF